MADVIIASPEKGFVDQMSYAGSRKGSCGRLLGNTGPQNENVDAKVVIKTSHDAATGNSCNVETSIAKVFAECLRTKANFFHEIVKDKNVVNIGPNSDFLGRVALEMGARTVESFDFEGCSSNDSITELVNNADGYVDTVVACDYLSDLSEHALSEFANSMNIIAQQNKQKKKQNCIHDEAIPDAPPLRLIVATQGREGWEMFDNYVKEVLNRQAGWELEKSESLLNWDTVWDDAGVYSRNVDSYSVFPPNQ